MREVQPWSDYWMDVAFKVTTRSKDPSTQVGAVIVTDSNSIVTTGYNGFPRKMKETSEHWNDRPRKYKTVIHAEVNAIGIAAKEGRSTDGTTMYCTHFPCIECAKAIIAAGIKKVIWRTLVHGWAEANLDAKVLFEASGIELFQHVGATNV